MGGSKWPFWGVRTLWMAPKLILQNSLRGTEASYGSKIFDSIQKLSYFEIRNFGRISYKECSTNLNFRVLQISLSIFAPSSWIFYQFYITSRQKTFTESIMKFYEWRFYVTLTWKNPKFWRFLAIFVKVSTTN